MIPDAVRFATKTAAWRPGAQALPKYLAGSSATRSPSASTSVVEPPTMTPAATVPIFVPAAWPTAKPYPCGE